MGKNIKYGEFTFNKPNPRPTVKGYSFGGAAESAAEPMAAKQPMGMSPPLNPTKKPVVTPPPAPLTPAMQRQKENQTFINKLNADPKRAGNQLLIDPNAMKTALDKNLAIRQATDARLKAEAKANAIPSKNPYARSTMPIAKQKGGEVKGYAMGGEYELDAPIQRRNAKLKTIKLKMAEDAKRNAAQSKNRAEQQMGQGKTNLLPSSARAPAPDSPSRVMTFKKGGEAQGYAGGGISARAKAMSQKMAKPNVPQPAPMVQPQPTVLPEMPPQRFANSSALQGKTGLSNMLLNRGSMPSSPPMNSVAPQGKMGALGNFLGAMPPPMPMAQPMGGLPSYAQSNNSQAANFLGLAPTQQPTGQMPSWMQSQINQLATQPPGYDIPSWAQPYVAQFPAQQPMGGIPSNAQPFMNQANQSPVNAPTQAGMPPQMAGSGIGNIGVGTGTGTGTMSAFKRGGSVSKGKAMESSSKDKAQDKAMIKKAMKQHDQQEHKGGKGTVLKLKNGGKAPVKAVKLVGMKREPIAVVKKEVSLLKKAGAPAKMIKEEMTEAIPAMACGGGMRKGGSAMKKGVPTFNRTPKC